MHENGKSGVERASELDIVFKNVGSCDKAKALLKI
jgi:hypothetical protein